MATRPQPQSVLALPWIRVSCLLVLLAIVGSLQAGPFRAGVARERITPPTPFWLTGYASRTNPAPRINSELWTKALALQDPAGNPLVLVTTDLIGLPRAVSDAVAERALRQHGLPRSGLILNSSHTHSGPVIWPNLRVMFDLAPGESARVEQYARDLTDSLCRVIDAALANLAPARLDVGHGKATFAINRRQPTPRGVVLGLNPAGPVDHDVPVLKVSSPEGRLQAVLFGYACHNTTLGGDFYQIDGDYAGAAQRNLEMAHPGATALFLLLCGGDQNPNPRGTLQHVDQHGRELATAVEQALQGPLTRISPPIRTAVRSVTLEFAPHTRAGFEQESTNSSVFRQRRARLMLEAYEAGQPVRSLDYPVQAARLGNELTLLALGGEVVIDYALRTKREFPAENLVVAAYCHEVACYIPSLRVLREGGYEPVDSMIYYGQPGPFADSVEERVMGAVHRVLRRVGARTSSP